MNRLAAITVATITVICMTVTIFFAYNCSQEHPRLPGLVAKTPQRTIVILNVLSQLTLFVLAELTTLTMEATRWALACRRSGTSALTFAALSQATSLMGVLYLAFGNSGGTRGPYDRKIKSSEHRIWSAQRYTF